MRISLKQINPFQQVFKIKLMEKNLYYKQEMPNILQKLYEENINEIGNLKTDKDRNQDFIDNLLKMFRCFSFDVYNNNIHMDVSNKVELLKQYRQSVMNSENVNFFKSVIQNFQRLKIMTMVVVYGKSPKFLHESRTIKLIIYNKEAYD